MCHENYFPPGILQVADTNNLACYKVDENSFVRDKTALNVTVLSILKTWTVKRSIPHFLAHHVDLNAIAGEY